MPAKAEFATTKARIAANKRTIPPEASLCTNSAKGSLTFRSTFLVFLTIISVLQFFQKEYKTIHKYAKVILCT